ncbi:acetyl-CoA carboxylase, carboxyltransferase subunit beta [Gammaproteobacteria bacterium]|nr:acetyl-CoA carboxylase, carboxyltransferase subunit beta [Gammaproteobacteria bacterium]
MSWLEKILPSLTEPKSSSVKDGVWQKCPKCEAILYKEQVDRHEGVCYKCDHHFRLSSKQRMDLLFADQPTRLIGENVIPRDFLQFKDLKKYKDRLKDATTKTKASEALQVQSGKLKGLDVVVAAFEFGFIGGSMGFVVGERFVQGVHFSIKHQMPLICFTASGGARMQEGVFSLFQMSKTSAALAKLAKAKLPYIVVLTDPTTGGVSASLGMLGDITIAEPNALIGFAGPRVIEQTVREVLPEGFQRSEFLLEHGAIDMVVHRHALSEKLHQLLIKLMHDKQYAS